MTALSRQHSAVSPCGADTPARQPRLRTTITRGRQTGERVERAGVFFVRCGRHLRSVYRQMDGTAVLSEECTCRVEWPQRTRRGFNFAIRWDLDCVIDEHKLLARTEDGEAAA